MDSIESLYGQPATSFVLRLFLRKQALVPGKLIVDLARSFLADLVTPPSRATWLWTGRANDEAKLNTGDFSERRWSAAVKKIASGEFNRLSIFAASPASPREKVSFSVGGGTIDVTCSVSYLKRLAASQPKVEALLDLGISAWNGVPGAPAYGYGNIGFIPPRVPFNPSGAQSPGYPPLSGGDAPPPQRAHAIPVAWVGADVDGNLDRSFESGKGIKGAFWANYLSEPYVRMAGGAQAIAASLPGIRIESLNGGGVLVVATESPLPEDSQRNRQRFEDVHRVLRPAFLSRAETAENMRALLGHFYREHP